MKDEVIANLSLPLLSPKNSVSSGKRGGVLEKKPFIAELIKQHVVTAVCIYNETHSWQPTILQDAESMQNVTQDHKILH